MNTQFRIVLLTAVLFLLSGLGRQLLAQTEPSELDQYQLKTSREVLVEYQLAPTPTGARKFLSALLPEATIDPEIEVLVGQLGSDKYDLRRAAEVKLVAKGARALRALTVASKSASTEVRVRSRRCIEQIKLVSPSIVRSAIQVLHYDNRPEELEAFPADQRVQLLMKLFDVVDDDLDKRILCAAIFENAGPNSQELVTAGLESDHTSLRLFCVRALPKCFSSLELKKFERLISSDDIELSFEAIRSFGEEFPEALSHNWFDFWKPIRPTIVLRRSLCCGDFLVKNLVTLKTAMLQSGKHPWRNGSSGVIAMQTKQPWISPS